MNIMGNYPDRRMRRNRRTASSRRLTQENILTTNDLIYPVFVLDERDVGNNTVQPVPSMPGVSRYTPDALMQVAENALSLGILVD